MRFAVFGTIGLVCAMASCIAGSTLPAGDDCVGVDGGPCGLALGPPDAGDATVYDATADAPHDSTTETGGE